MPNNTVDVANGAPHKQGYTDNGNGTVTDGVTGLVWQQVVPTAGGPKNDGVLTWDQANAYCVGLTLAQHHDWRLPSRIELFSITDQSVPAQGPTIDAAKFINTPTDDFWSSTLVAGAPSQAWVVYFNFASTNYNAVAGASHVRCVR